MDLASARSGVLPADSATSFKNTTPKTPFPNIRDILKNLNIEYKAFDINNKNMSAVLGSLSEKGMTDAGQKAIAELTNIRQITDELVLQWREKLTLNETLATVGSKLFDTAHALTTSLGEEIERDYGYVRFLYPVIGSVMILLMLMFSILISRSITKVLANSIEKLRISSDQMAAAAKEISQGSMELSDATSQQAAALEETSSAIKEMASMTSQNAGNAAHLQRLMTETTRTFDQADRSLEQLTSSMADIFRASEQIQKIVKTIDEIAFQTNLLALNAAVEAARAGEAGAGFTVVADELRNLAMRAADAAKNTTKLIELTIANVNTGSSLVGKTNTEFRGAAQSVSESSKLASEIAAASQEQAQGISQVTRTLLEIDRVTQKTASNAEESASASEEMSSQARQIKDYISGLAELVGGSDSGEA